MKVPEPFCRGIAQRNKRNRLVCFSPGKGSGGTRMHTIFCGQGKNATWSSAEQAINLLCWAILPTRCSDWRRRISLRWRWDECRRLHRASRLYQSAMRVQSERAIIRRVRIDHAAARRCGTTVPGTRFQDHAVAHASRPTPPLTFCTWSSKMFCHMV